MKVLNSIKGGKTIGIAIAIIGYSLYCVFTDGQELDIAVVSALMGGGLWTLRTGIKNSGSATS